jgi:hypothetical protein
MLPREVETLEQRRRRYLSMAKHVRESGLAASDPKTRAEFLKIAAIWDELAKGKSVLSYWDSSNFKMRLARSRAHSNDKRSHARN